jgi:hypothetical protein
MQTPPRPTPRESTEAMVRNIDREVHELRAALAQSRGDRMVEPKVTAALLTHLLISSKELLQNLLIDTAQRLQRINAPE